MRCLGLQYTRHTYATDLTYCRHRRELSGGAPPGTADFLSALPSLVESATRAHPEWQLIVLTPINEPWDFYT